ncbi:MAG: hypothetical protein QM766_16615 [Burkholderiaceae bacterium]
MSALPSVAIRVPASAAPDAVAPANTAAPAVPVSPSVAAAPPAAAAPAAPPVDPRDPWRQQRALVWTDVTTAEQARLVLHGRCAATGRPWVLPTEPASFISADGHDAIDDHTLWMCQRLLGLGRFVERVRSWRDGSRPYYDETAPEGALPKRDA